jgi:FtsH-binding integral membrane protein
MGAPALYLDFINMFVRLLQLVGQRREYGRPEPAGNH